MRPKHPYDLARRVTGRFSAPVRVRCVLYMENLSTQVYVEQKDCLDVLSTMMDALGEVGLEVRAAKVHADDDWFAFWTWEMPGWRKHPRYDVAQLRTAQMRPTMREDWG